MKLNYKSFGEGNPVLILHGLFGMLDNWQQFAKRLASGYKVYIIDLRNHGRSPHSDIFDYDVMSEDLALFLDYHHISQTDLIGHSMGGKLALRFASLYPNYVDKTIIIDIGIKKYKPKHRPILKALNSLNLSQFTTRNQIDDKLEETIPNKSIRKFLLKNVSRNIGKHGYHWKMNIEAITNNYDLIIDKIELKNNIINDCLFIKGVNSDYILEEDKKDILLQIPNAKFITVQNAGHWVHAEQAKLLLDIVDKYLSS